MLNGLSLFSGIGGIDLALSEWIRPVGYVEINPCAAGALFSRMLDGALPIAPIFPDVRHVTAGILPPIDAVCAGTPCQGISEAGLRRGLEDDRSGLFFEYIRILRETEPIVTFWENVGGATEGDLRRVAAEINNAGYEARAGTLAAGHLGFRQKRMRIWVLAYRAGEPMEGYSLQRFDDAHAERRDEKARRDRALDDASWRKRADHVFRNLYGVRRGVDRIEALGNSVVPQCAKEAFKRLMGIA